MQPLHSRKTGIQFPSTDSGNGPWRVSLSPALPGNMPAAATLFMCLLGSMGWQKAQLWAGRWGPARCRSRGGVYLGRESCLCGELHHVKHMLYSILCLLVTLYLFVADLKEWKNNTWERIPAKCSEEGSPEIRTGVLGSRHISQGPWHRGLCLQGCVSLHLHPCWQPVAVNSYWTVCHSWVLVLPWKALSYWEKGQSLCLMSPTWNLHWPVTIKPQWR